MERIYCVVNRLSGRNTNPGLYLFPTDSYASAELGEAIGKSPNLHIEECNLYCLGTYNTEENKIIADKGYIVPWDLRRLKEPKMEDKTPEEVKKDLSNI